MVIRCAAVVALFNIFRSMYSSYELDHNPDSIIPLAITASTTMMMYLTIIKDASNKILGIEDKVE